MKKHIIVKIEFMDHPITLEQNGPDLFTVTYGEQVKTDLDYGEAAEEFGLCVMHSAACKGLLDNE